MSDSDPDPAHDCAWRPGASLQALHARGALLATIRAFFNERGVLEVDTPVIGRFGVTDPAIEPLLLAATPEQERAPRFLQSSPEFFMKRLLAAGSGPIYQLGKVFRAGESGARHNPEFTLLEWYRPDFELSELAREVAELVQACLPPLADLPVHYRTYAEVFEAALGIDPHRASAQTLAAAAARVTDTGSLDLDRDGWLDLLMSHAVEPTLRGQGLVFVFDYPASQAALARCVDRDDLRVADRFEAFFEGVELANGYRELRDAATHRRRAEDDNRRRRRSGQAGRRLDPRLLAALEHGLPDCSGVALGVDRLLMALLGCKRLDEILPFAWERA